MPSRGGRTIRNLTAKQPCSRAGAVAQAASTSLSAPYVRDELPEGAGKKTPALSMDLGRREVKRKNGAERLENAGADLGVNLQTFWQWSASDLLSNVTRGRFAEFIVARALSIPTDGVRDEWAAFDLTTSDGLKVEVKSAAFVQSWHQARLSSISFLTPATRAWDAATNVQSQEVKRQADVYVFALLAHTDKSTINPLEVAQWRFYVLPTSLLNGRTRSQHSITLRTLEKECGPGVSFSDLARAVKEAGRVNANDRP